MKISIITINYNNAEGLDRTIKSVVSQTYLNKEYIIVDGASSDNSLDVIRKYSESITKSLSEPDTGIYNAMNKGIRMATGDYCIFLNSGDVFFSSIVLEKVSNYLQTGKDIYNGNSLFTDSNGKITWYRKGHRDISKYYFYHSSICHQASFIKTSVIKGIMYDESLKMVSDWKFWIEAICINNVSYAAINVDVCCYDECGITTTQHERGVAERRKVIQELYSSEEITRYEELSKKRIFTKYFIEGITKRFWLYYALLFKQEHVYRTFGN